MVGPRPRVLLTLPLGVTEGAEVQEQESVWFSDFCVLALHFLVYEDNLHH